MTEGSDSSPTPGKLRAAATTVALRSAPEGLELLFVRRPHSMRAFGGYHAFPGGAVDPEDYEALAIEASSLSPDEAAEKLGPDDSSTPAIGFFVCAIRELFEEVDLLYAVRDGKDVVLSGDEVGAAREKLRAGGLLPEIALEMGLKLATHRLSFLARWVAPEALPIRFDARVFVTRAAGQPTPDPDEVERIDWLSPQRALLMAEGNEILLAPPTMASVSKLARFTSVDEVFSEKMVAPSSNIVEVHSPYVRRIVAPNSTVMTGPGTNTYLVGTDEVIVIDPGSQEHLHLYSISSAVTVSKIVVTHGHPDHVGGAAELAAATGAPVFVTRKLAERYQAANPLVEGDTVEVDGLSLQVLETPGHSSDHICLWFEVEKALFSGDLILGEGTTVISPPDGNLRDYMTSLEKVAQLGAERIYPGHFPPRDDAASWIEYYIAHRNEREQQILDAIANRPLSPAEIVAEVYSSYPPALHPIAERSVQAHLDKLLEEGRAKSVGEKFATS
jgi:glyoxylase-like metal-dependent hydrolase (beta-lactamase superfamily II)/8-oxo-dGTP pyrophosphatase MutT (NUDIX family)